MKCARFFFSENMKFNKFSQHFLKFVIICASQVEADSDGDLVPKSTRRLRAALSDPLSLPGSIGLGSFDEVDSLMWQTVKEYHRLLPKTKVRSWVANLTSFLQGASADGRLPVGSGCLGCVIGNRTHGQNTKDTPCASAMCHQGPVALGHPQQSWLLLLAYSYLCLLSLRMQWYRRLAALPPCTSRALGCRVRPALMRRGAQVRCRVRDGEAGLPQAGVPDHGHAGAGRDGVHRPPRHERLDEQLGVLALGAGVRGRVLLQGEFEAELEAQGEQRLHSPAGGQLGDDVRSDEGLHRKEPPEGIFSENVPDVQQSVEQTDGTSASDAEYVKEVFHKEGFFVLTVECSCRSYGSPAERRRWRVVGFDIPADKRDGVEQSFHETFESFRMDPYRVEKILLSEEFIASIDHSFDVKSHKKNKGDVMWKTVHEAAYADMDVAWPPDISALWMFRDREAEVVFLANHLFPCKELGMWSFFDSNHCLERSLKWPAQGDHGLRNPWKEYIPTMTAGSAIACRRVNEDSSITLKKLHGLESFRAIGWDLGHWNGNPFQHEEVTSDLLNDMAGNAWSSWAFLPIAISAFGAAPWSKYRKDEEGVGSASSASASDSEASSV